jgi:tetratricopeptide (TPR) repeat protein
MGIVFKARQISLNRTVALKMILAGQLASEAEVKRFRAEAEAAASLDHQNIVAIHEVGEHEGQHYFSMRLVEGRSLAWSPVPVPPREAARLLATVARAVHFAHQRGILHRDLKPGNIVMDANGEPHVTDFGLAKRMDVDSGLTPSGTFIGTPSYMAPEQAVGQTGQLTTVADIYSLGAVLYFLLTGRPPFVGATPLETLRLVVEKEPVRPSTINRRLDRDLETICLKCLEKAPQGRYASADAVAEDLDRWLRQEPIQARPSGAWEHIFKWAKRKPAIASLIGAVFAVTAIGFAGVFWQWRRAQASAGAARVEAADNQQVTKFLQEMLEGVQPSVALGRDTTLLREVLKKAETRVDEELKYQPGVQSHLHLIIGRVYFELGDYVKAEAMCRQSLALEEKLHGGENQHVVMSIDCIARVLLAQGRLAEAEPMFRQTLAMQKKLLGAQHEEVASRLHNLAVVLRTRGKLAEAEALHREALAMQRRLLAHEHPDIARSLGGLAAASYDHGKLAEAAALHREALAMEKKLLGEVHPDVALALNNLAAVLLQQGNPTNLAEAETLFRQAMAMRKQLLGEEHPDVAQSLANLGAVLGKQGGPGKLAEAETLLRQALAIRTKSFGAEHADVAGTLHNLGFALMEEGKLAEAETTLRQALAMRKKLLGEENQDTAASLASLAALLTRQGKPGEAEAMLREALAMLKRLFGNEHPIVAQSLANLATVIAQQGKLKEAEAMYREALAMQKKGRGNENPDVATSLNNLATVLWQEGRRSEAEAMLREALAMRKKLFGNEHPDVAGSLANVAALLVAQQGKLAQAEAMYREALAMQQKVLGNEHPDVATSLNGLAVVLQQQGKLSEAEAMHREALAMRKRLLGDEHPDVATSLHNIALVLNSQGKLAEADALHRDALAMRKKLLGDEHPDVADSLNGLAILLQAEGKTAEAEALLRQSLAMQKKLLGGEHEKVAGVLNNLAAVLEQEQNFVEAEALHHAALVIRKKLFGEDHPSVAESLGNLGKLLGRQRRLTEAESVFGEALAIRKKLFGAEHPEIAESLDDISVVLAQQGRLADAEALEREALSMRKKLLGNDHSAVVRSLNNLAVALRDQGRPAEAEALFVESLAIEKKLIGEENPQLEHSLLNLAGLFASQGKLDEEETVRRQILALNRKALGEEHPSVSAALLDLALTLAERGKAAEYETVRTEATLVRLGLSPARRQELGPARAVQVVTDAIESGSFPTNENASSCLAGRSALLGQQGRWQAAIEDLSQATRLDPALPPQFVLGPMLAEVGDFNGYRNHRRRLIAKNLATHDPLTAAETAMGMVLQPAEGGPSIASELAEMAVIRGTNHVRFAYFQLVQGLLEYRRGHLSAACDWAGKSLDSSGTDYATGAAAGALLAMAQQQSQQPDRSRATLAQAVELSHSKLPKLDSGDLGESWPEWLVARILLREAGNLIEKKGLHLPRSPDATPTLIDLTAYYNAGLNEAWHFGQGAKGTDLAALPTGVQTLAGVRFDVRGIIQLSSKRSQPWFPEKVEGIRIGQKCRTLNFLQATGWMAKDGARIGSFVIHYADGQNQELPIVYGEDTREWHGRSDAVQTITQGKLAWSWPGDDLKRRLFISSRQNPLPDLEITTVDYISAMTDCFPFLIALTVE